MIRYRDRSNGLTRYSLRKAKANLGNLGFVTEIRGYRFTSTRTLKNTAMPYKAQHNAVLVKGPGGSMRFEGVLWGYGGEGPRGLVQILRACGLSMDAAQAIAHNTPLRSENGVDFSIKFPAPVPINPHVIEI